MPKSPKKADVDEDLVRKLASLLEETGLTEIEYGTKDWHLRVVRGTPPSTGGTGANPAAAAAERDAVHISIGGLPTAEQVRVDSTSGWDYNWAWDAAQTMWLRWMFTSSQLMSVHHGPTASAPEWTSLYYLLPHDRSSHGHTATLKRPRRGGILGRFGYHLRRKRGG